MCRGVESEYAEQEEEDKLIEYIEKPYLPFMYLHTTTTTTTEQ